MRSYIFFRLDLFLQCELDIMFNIEKAHFILGKVPCALLIRVCVCKFPVPSQLLGEQKPFPCGTCVRLALPPLLFTSGNGYEWLHRGDEQGERAEAHLASRKDLQVVDVVQSVMKCSTLSVPAHHRKARDSVNQPAYRKSLLEFLRALAKAS